MSAADLDIAAAAAVLFEELATDACALDHALRNCESINGEEWAVLHAFVRAIGANADAAAIALGGSGARAGSAEWLLSPVASSAMQGLRDRALRVRGAHHV